LARSLYDLADIIRQHRPELEAATPLSPVQGRALSAMTLCRTSALGGHLDFCPACGLAEGPSYNSCRNRNCPKCQGLAQERWITARTLAILPIPHFHGVLTLPTDLRPLGRRHPRESYDALLRSSSEAILELGRSRLGVTLGLTTILHTWNRELLYHLHTHLLITAGGLTLDGTRFKRVEEKFLLHLKPRAQLFKGKRMAALRVLQEEGVSGISAGAFGVMIASLQEQRWHVYLNLSGDLRLGRPAQHGRREPLNVRGGSAAKRRPTPVGAGAWRARLRAGPQGTLDNSAHAPLWPRRLVISISGRWHRPYLDSHGGIGMARSRWPSPCHHHQAKPKE
jgi:hypothetical protein